MNRTKQYILIGLILANVIAFIVLYQRFETQKPGANEIDSEINEVVVQEPQETNEPTPSIEMTPGYVHARPTRPDELKGVSVIVSNGTYHQELWDSVKRYYDQLWMPESDWYDGYMDEVRTASFNEQVAEDIRQAQEAQQSNPTPAGNSSKKTFFTYHVGIDIPIIWQADEVTYYYINTLRIEGNGINTVTGDLDEVENHRFEILELLLENGQWLVNRRIVSSIDPSLFQNMGNARQTQ